MFTFYLPAIGFPEKSNGVSTKAVPEITESIDNHPTILFPWMRQHISLAVCLGSSTAPSAIRSYLETLDLPPIALYRLE